MLSQKLAGGVAHAMPMDLRKSLIAQKTTGAWQDITALARNEYICWVLDAKQPETRARRIRRTSEQLQAGQRRPCCWMGCSHREKNGK